MQIELSNEEAHLLRDMLAGYLTDLRMEIADTDAKDFRDHLKHREVLLTRVLADLGTSGR